MSTVHVRILSLKAAAEKLGVSEAHLTRLARDGRIPSNQLSGKYGAKSARWFNEPDVLELKNKRIQSA